MRASDLEYKFVLVFVEAAKHQILGGDQILVILCGFGTKILEFGISFLSMTISGAASSLIPLSHGSFDVIVGMDRLSKRKFVIVCHEKVVRIPLEGDEMLRVRGERTQGVVKTLMNTKSCKTKVSYDLVLFRREHQCHLLRRGAWSSFEVSVRITEEGEVVTYLRFITNFSKVVKPHTSPTERNQKYEWGTERAKLSLKGTFLGDDFCVTLRLIECVKDKILATQSETSKGMMRAVVMDEAHASRYLVHPGVDKTYYNLEDMLQCQRLLACCNNLRYLSENEIESPWISSQNFQGQSSEYNVNWVMVDRLTKSTHFLAIREDYSTEKLAKISIDEINAAESDSDAIRFEYCLASSSGWTNIRCAPFEALYGRKCRSHVIWAEIGGSSLIGPERKPLEFEVGDRVMLNVSLWKGVIRFGGKGKLAPSGVHDMFHVSNLKKCLADASLHVPLDEIKVDKTLRSVRKHVVAIGREVIRLKCSRMVIVKVWFWLEVRSLRLQAKLLAVRSLGKVSWNSKCNFELTWVWEDYLKDEYP
ncbi:hypothetical protein Tco_0856495 [Tanacetum coccineum]|uniref:Uncharacterized protein n=1 Tax=Tanacetum coccineum TaxID=301880 RepID=A0ABQ5B7E4_9ASTR